ncbi:UNVERIFIED_CONTAM: MptD family putative ECF transporter S component [Streptococcus canis]|uniref:MptD family putative ECF transporter S component n=1 Tax=Streptococcus canis TaxID=1329 RepID=UPI000B8AC780|nr:MptD family putative ECF transporter S component [Streptococcus canis]MDW7797530.1 MptD family putative ECF transporter S component [Streptococcus canis]MDW7799159.1 MptD family putative ECF transporter S component [Streptococcus canis]QJD12926.1 MptD family putative ECF transporter S component [Streptococcus canis]QKG76253.1 MptD family putative ECF transporter S component [Streptococcus canis]VTR80589.1 membrane-bound protein [Streptococcus canis]
MKQLRIKDIMTTGAFAALYFICVGMGTLIGIFFDHSGNMLYAPAFAALLGGTVYFLLIAKLQKFGPVTLLGLIMGGFFFLSGHFFAAMFPSIVFGFLADVIASLGKYKSRVFNNLSYLVFAFVNSGPILLMWLLKDAYVESLLARGKDMAYVNRVMYDFSLGHVTWFVGTVLVGALLGSAFAHYLLRKHFAKSGLLS